MVNYCNSEFYQKIKENLADWELRLVFADFLEETGQEVLAVGQRWQTANKKHPTDQDRKKSGEYWWTWHGWNQQEVPTNPLYLSWKVFDLLLDWKCFSGDTEIAVGSRRPSWKDYDTLELAEYYLAEAVYVLENPHRK